MKNIDTLIPDVYNLLQTKGWFTDELADDFASSVAKRLQEKFNEERAAPTLRMSKLGPWCHKALWGSIHRPEEAEDMPPWAEFKFSYGHLIEAFAITLAKAAGHTVTGEQDAVSLDGVIGHRDCVIDGVVVDVKSCSSRSFLKFRDRSLATNDSFGYLDQLDGYVVGSYSDPLVSVKDVGYLWAIDKTLGHMVLYRHEVRPREIRERIARYKEVIRLERPPVCTCGEVEDGKSGNRKLDTRASYSPWKYFCKPYLRTFRYSDGPRYLTKVVRLPDVTEITRYGRPLQSNVPRAWPLPNM